MLRYAVVPLFVIVAAGCSISIEDQQGEPRCEGDSNQMIAAQSVPSASLVFCFDGLPDGWTVDNTRIDQDGTVIHFDSDRAGDNAAIFHYTATCEVGDAAYQPSEHEGAERYENIERVPPGFRAQRYYTFEGGCMWWEFDFEGDATSGLAVGLGEHLETMSRDEANARVRDSFIDEDL
jgi:hypothetical protein